MDYSWAKPLLNEFLDKEEDLAQVMHISIYGVGRLCNADDVARAADRYDEARSKIPDAPSYDPEKNRQEIEHAEKIAKFARYEADRGYRTIVSNTCVAAWGVLESFVEDLAVACLEHDPDLLQSETCSKLRIQVAEFMVLSEEERRRLLVQELARSVRSESRLGLGKFEGILSAVGLGGTAPEECRKALIELAEIRNCLVHRSGRADRRLVTACPWLNLAQGDAISVTVDDFGRYTSAICAYFVELASRTGLATKVEPAESGAS